MCIKVPWLWTFLRLYFDFSFLLLIFSSTYDLGRCLIHCRIQMHMVQPLRHRWVRNNSRAVHDALGDLLRLELFRTQASLKAIDVTPLHVLHPQGSNVTCTYGLLARRGPQLIVFRLLLVRLRPCRRRRALIGFQVIQLSYFSTVSSIQLFKLIFRRRAQ